VNQTRGNVARSAPVKAPGFGDRSQAMSGRPSRLLPAGRTAADQRRPWFIKLENSKLDAWAGQNSASQWTGEHTIAKAEGKKKSRYPGPALPRIRPSNRRERRPARLRSREAPRSDFAKTRRRPRVGESVQRRAATRRTDERGEKRHASKTRCTRHIVPDESEEGLVPRRLGFCWRKNVLR